jgi:ribosomal protein S27E
MESIEVDRDAMESFFSTVDDSEQPALLPSGGPFDGTEGPGLFASMKADPEGEESFQGLTRDILAEKTPKEDKSLSLDSLFSPIMDDDEEDEEELISELSPMKSDGFGDNFLDDLLTLVPFEDDDMKNITPEEESVRIEETVPKTDEAPLEVACYNCNNSIPIYTDERPLIITCSGCGAQGEIE